METTPEINLTEEKETLFITLYAKALDSRSKHPVLNDTKANELIKSINYDFSKFKDFGSNIIVVRAKQFDEWIREFIGANPDGVIVYLGCGLDTRINRINPSPEISWFDVDYPEVINFRKKFYSDRPGYRMIGSSVISSNWLNAIPSDKPTMIICEGMLEYLTEDEVKSLVGNLMNYFSQGQIIFDVMNSFAIKSGKERLKNTTGAVHKWAVDNVAEIDGLSSKWKRVKELPVFKSVYLRKFSFPQRILFYLLSLIPSFKNMMRLMWYQF